MACAAVVVAVLAAHVAPASSAVAPAPLHLHAARLTQDGQALVLRLATSRPWTATTLARDGRSLCLRLASTARAVAARDVCVAAGGGRTRLVYARVLRSGGHGPLHPLPARVRQPDPRSLVARFSPARIGVPWAPVRWRVLSRTAGCREARAGGCADVLPAAGATLRLHTPLPVGCTPRGPAFVTHGSRARRTVALTFDDGPWSDTPAFLDVLERERVQATFFLLGSQIAGNGALIRRMLADGDGVGDHTWDHADVAGDGPFARWEISATANAIERASGFRPCLFRAPFGSASPALAGLARSLGFTTVQWDVDPQDWSLPGSGAIAGRILGHVAGGSIVLMHDGGGPRGQTLAALPGVIDALKARGYRFVTVAQMTGAPLRYR